MCTEYLQAGMSLKMLKVNRGDQGLGENCIWGEIPPSLVLSPWVTLKKPESHLEADIPCSASGLKGPFELQKDVPSSWLTQPRTREQRRQAGELHFHPSQKLHDPKWEPRYISSQNRFLFACFVVCLFVCFR